MADGDTAVERARKEGNYFFKQKQYEAAISAYKKGLDVEKENVLLLSNLSQVYLVTGNYTEAEIMASRAVTLDPTWYKCYTRAAIAAENIGQLDKAIDYVKKGIEVLEASDAPKRHEISSELDNFKKELDRIEEKLRIRGFTAAQPCGLIFDSDNDDSEDYDVDSDTQSVSSLTSHSIGKDNMVRSDSLGKVNIIPESNVNRSRSSSVPPATLLTPASNKKKVEMPPPRSTSVVSNAKEKKKNKKRLGPIRMEDLEADPFISFLSNASLVPDDKVEREKFFQIKKKEIKTLLLEGSQALEADVYLAAVEKFRTVYDNIQEFPYQDLGLKEMDVVVVKYLLCFSWVSLTIYEDIIQAIKMMQDMEVTYSSKFPAIYYALGLAFYKLNRFKSAATYVEKGLEFVTKNLRLCAYPYPGTVSKPIKETTREGFESVLTELLKNCRTHHQPNAVCRYEDCRKLSQHIEPSELIFYNDPDFNGFIVIICEEKCRIEYHVHCWKDFKESSSIQKVTDKDMLGQNCPTKDCVTKKNQHSVIVRIEVMGENAAIKTALDLSRNADSMKDMRMNRRKHLNSESLAEKFKQRFGNEKPKEKEYESVKELRRQEKYRKSELESEQENNHKQEEPSESQKSVNKIKLEDKQRVQKSLKEQRTDTDIFPKELGKVKKTELTQDKTITVERSVEDYKMLHENEFKVFEEFGTTYDQNFDNGECCEEGESDVILDAPFLLYDDDCFVDLNEEMLLGINTSLNDVNSDKLRLLDPSKAFFGAEILKEGTRFLPETEIKSPEDDVKEFICSYMYEYLRSADSQSVQDVDEKWLEDADELKMDLSRVEKYQSQISELLLISPFFAALDDHFGLAEFVPVICDVLKEELKESYNFIFCRNEETQEYTDIYNSQEDLYCDESDSINQNEIKRCEVQINETENIVDENSDVLNVKEETKENCDDKSGVDKIECSNQMVDDKVSGEEFETSVTKEHQTTRNSLNPDATEFCLTSDSLEVCKVVTPKEASIENSIVASQVLDIQHTNDFPSNYNNIKWSTEDGVSKLQNQWDPNTILKQWSTNSGQPDSLTGTIQNGDLSLQEVKFSLTKDSFTAISELLAPESEDQQPIWTGVLKWTALENTSRSFSCSVICSSKVKHIKLSASMWPQEMTMQLVSRAFIEAIGIDTLCQLSDVVTFKPAVDKSSDLLSQDLGSEFVGFIINKTPADTTFIVVIYLEATHTYVGLAPHQYFMILSGMLADFCHQQSLGDVQAKKMEIGVQTDGPDYNEKLKDSEEKNKKMKMLCDSQKGRIVALESLVETLKFQQKSLQSQLDTKEKVCAELSEKFSQQGGERAHLEQKINNLEKHQDALDSTLREQVKSYQDLDSRYRQHITEKKDLEKRLSDTEKKWMEDKEQITTITKRHELSEKLLSKKVEAVEQTNRTLRESLNSSKNEFKRQLDALKAQNIAQNEELTSLRQKLAEAEQHQQQLETSNETLKAQEGRLKEQQLNLKQEVFNSKFQTANRETTLIKEFCKGRIEELTNLASVILSSGNTVLANEVNNWLKIWQSCFKEAVQHLETLKESYIGLVEKIRLGEVANIPESNITLPSQPQNIVDVIMKMNKKTTLLPTPIPMMLQNPSHFAGNPVYYPPFTNSMYIPQPNFAQIPGMNMLPSQRHVPAYPGNQMKPPEPVPDNSSSVRMSKAPFTALQNTRVNNSSINIVDPVTGNDLSLIAQRLSSPQLQTELTNNTVQNSQLRVTQAIVGTAATSAETKPVEAPKAPPVVAAPKVPIASTPFVSNTTDLTKTIPLQPKPVAPTISSAGTPAVPTVSLNKLANVPIKNVAAHQPTPADTSVNSTAKPPSLLDLPIRMPGTQTGKVQQNPKPKSANFQKLLTDLRKKYPNKSDEDLEACVAVVRERNNNKLTGLPLPTIVTMVGKVLQEQARKKDGGSMGLDKFGTSAWQMKSAETIQWSKPKDTSDEECTICIEPLGTQTTTLYCKHSFHTSCIRTWLRNESVCPICRVYTRMADEFPPLG